MQIDIDVPEGQRGAWKVERFTVDETASNMSMFFGHFGRGIVPPGAYTRLKQGRTTVMSNTPDELRDHLAFKWHAKGRVLVNGLGLGVVIEMVAAYVEHITVIEIEPDVIALVAPHYLSKYPGKVDIIQADAYEYKPPKGARYDAVWHDVWPDICSDNLPEMARLHRKYGRRANWQGSWCRGYCERARGTGY